MIKASSLFYAIVISILIAIISSCLILFSSLSHLEFLNYEILQRLNLNADSGINLLLTDQSLVSPGEKTYLDLYNKGNDSVELHLKPWGAHEIAISMATFQNKKATRIAQIGSFTDSADLYSIYLADENKILALSGKTLIKGTAYLPKAGVKRAYIEGQNFSGNKLIEGDIKTSQTKLPEFNKNIFTYIQKVFANKIISDHDSVVEIKNELSTDTLKNSFLSPTILFRSSASITINEGVFSGNIAIISSNKIHISNGAILNDIILFAPKITIGEDVKGNFQAFATDTILIAKNVSLSYPSVLGLVTTPRSPQVSSILTEDNDTISGSLFVFKENQNQQKHSVIIIKKNVFINGEVYSNDITDVQGTINGSLMCQKILLITPSSVYENHLLNATIDVTKRSGYFTGINILKEDKIKRVVKWFN
jgi:hypothetical protein